ncbi:hypothetical protein VTK56DRAFT_6720 [Thermocarpiscus australiensis]
MSLKPTGITATIAGLLEAVDGVSQLVQPAFQPDQAKGQKRATRIRYELNNARSVLQQLQHVLGRLAETPSERKRLVEVRQVAAVLGAGALVVSQLEAALMRLRTLCGGDGDPDRLRQMRHEARGEVWDMMRGLQDFGASTWFILTILESPSDDDVANSCETLRAAVAAILGKDNELCREIKTLYPDPETGALDHLEQATAVSTLDESIISPCESTTTENQCRQSTSVSTVVIALDDTDDSDDEASGPPTPASSEFPRLYEQRLATLADISSLDAIVIPVPHRTNGPGTETQHGTHSLEVITVSCAGVDISPLRQLCSAEDQEAPPVPAPETTLSAETVFQLPEVTEAVVLDFFRRAVHVSRFAQASATATGFSPRARDKLRGLSPPQFRKLSTDVYDELVLRNVEERNKGLGRAVGRAHILEPQALGPLRVASRERLSGLSDMQLRDVILAVMDELEDRIQATGPEPKQSWSNGRSRTSTARLSAVLGDG